MHENDETAAIIVGNPDNEFINFSYCNYKGRKVDNMPE